MGSGFRVQGPGSRVGSGFRVQGSGFGVQGSRFRLEGCWCRTPGHLTSRLLLPPDRPKFRSTAFLWYKPRTRHRRGDMSLNHTPKTLLMHCGYVQMDFGYKLSGRIDLALYLPEISADACAVASSGLKAPRKKKEGRTPGHVTSRPLLPPDLHLML